jgi:hypothetical protein
MSEQLGSRASQIAYGWARAAFTLAHYGDRDPDAALLQQKVCEFWAPLDYTGDEDEIIRVAILEAVKEINGE